MTRISQADQALLLLRARLQELGRSRRMPGLLAKTPSKVAAMLPRERLVALAEFDGLSEEDRHRLFVRSLLADVFGDAFSNDAKFLSVADEVCNVLSSNDEGKVMLRRAIEKVME